ncbi:MAG: F0F1 ATP synthase subunit B [Oscillospiraceae bacterium]|nr:F0F1 ATP synthase subunit B [Oscillospiraceae bacterium]MBQ7903074.1 F0F1 ATP synthase subunit B [Oscillospiraceae bacterium]
MDQYLGFFSVDVWTIIFTWVNMFILFTLVKKILFKPVSNILDQRDAEIKKIYDDANRANEKAVNLEKEYSEKMAQARDEAGEIIKQATLTAQKREKEIIDSAHQQVAAMTRRAETQIAQERKKAYQEIKEEISDISVAIAGKMVQREITAADHEALISQFIENVGEA